jgi:hypothetical protein
MHYDAEAARQQYRARNADGGADWTDDGDLICTAAAPHGICDIPPRPWAYGKFLQFGEAQAIGAVDGGGKGAMAVVIALSMITGRPLLDEHVWRKGPVAIIAYEDSEIEWRRRIAAACIHYKLDYESVIGSFYFIRHPGRNVSFAARGPSGNIVLPDGNVIVESLIGCGIVLFIIDPFNHAHSLEDGNSNALIAQVAREIARVARQSDTACLVLHHLRKGATGDPDDLLGALVLRATFRAVRILMRMTKEEANRLRLPQKQAWRYSRVAGTKANYAPPAERSTWYRLESVDLGNPGGIYSEGDNVQVTTTWTPPSAFEGVSLEEIADIFAKLRTSPGEGLRWSPDCRSNQWAGHPIAEITGKDDKEVARIVDAWVETTVLIKEKYKHPKSRRDQACVTLNEGKAAEILEHNIGD